MQSQPECTPEPLRSLRVRAAVRPTRIRPAGMADTPETKRTPAGVSGSMGRRPRVPVGPGRPPRAPDRPSRPANPRRERIKRIALWSGLGLFVSMLLAFGSVAGLFLYYGRDLPDVHRLRASWRPPQTTRILARDGSVLAEIYVERRTVVPLGRVPENLVRAVLAAEDADFYRHSGLDYLGMLRALWVNVRRGTTAQGASTITQQLVKNLLLSPQRTLGRKVREVLLARRIEQELTKNQILELYLNYIAFGHGRNGVEEASLFYFGRHVDQLTLGQCALLASIPKSPVHYSPRNNPEGALRRRHWVLGQMVSNHFVSQADADAADAEPLVLAEVRDDAEGTAPEVVEAARQMLRRTVGDEATRRGGYTVYTTIDPVLEHAAREAVQAGLRELDARQGYVGPLLPADQRRVRGHPGYVLPGEAPPADGRLLPGHIYAGIVDETVDPDPVAHREGAIFVRVGNVRGRVSWAGAVRYVRADTLPSTFAPRGANVRVSVERIAARDTTVGMQLELGPQGAFVAIDPVTREVRALIGGYEGIAGMFDRASRAMRQPGSSFKPFLYSAALATRRYTTASTVDPNPACFDRWCPREAHAHARDEPPEAPMRLREALAQSRNMVAARLIVDLGPPALVAQAARIGITSPLTPTRALALGTSEVTPLDLTNAYTTFAAAGRFAPPVLILRIVDPDGHDVPLPERAAARQALPPEEAYVMTSLLTSVVDHGTGVRARALRRPVAGKTGTSNDARDAWFIGYTPDLAAGAWVGFDDRQSLGRGEEGARAALPIWVQFMRAYIAARRPPPIDFARPDAIRVARIDPLTGLLARPEQGDAIDEVFLSGSEPTLVAPTGEDAGNPAPSDAAIVDVTAPSETIETPGEAPPPPPLGTPQPPQSLGPADAPSASPVAAPAAPTASAAPAAPAAVP